MLWVYRFADGVPKQFAADTSGGLLIRLSNDFGGSTSMPERIRRLDGQGHVDWEYLTKDGTLTDLAVGPDGAVYVIDEAYHRPGTDFVSLAAPGRNNDTRCPEPKRHTRQAPGPSFWPTAH